MDYTSLIASIPALIQAGTGAAQIAKGNRMGKGLTDPRYAIPQSEKDYLNMARNNAGNLNPAGYESFIRGLDQIMAGATNAIDRGATSAPQALGAALGAAGQQTKALSDYQGVAEQSLQNRQNTLMNALNSMAGYEERQQDYNKFQPFFRKAAASQALVGSGMQNTYAGLSDVAGVYANKRAARDDQGREDKWRQKLMDLYSRPTFSSAINSDAATQKGEESDVTVEGSLKRLNELFDMSGDAWSSQEDPEVRPYNKYSRNPQEMY